MNVFLSPVGLFSRSMTRTARALERYAPSGISIVQRREDADLVILHVIGYDALEVAEGIYASGRDYAVLQYCLRSTEYTREEDWLELWRCARVVTSYYDLSPWIGKLGTPFYHAPLGIDDAFRLPSVPTEREKLVITSGYVSGPSAEAIEEVWTAADIQGVRVIHVGPSDVAGIAPSYRPQHFECVSDISDEELANLYSRAHWVSGLRHAEGFELPAAEGIACGAVPLLFDQPSQRHWYSNCGLYVKDRSGTDLIDELLWVLSVRPKPSPHREGNRQWILNRFDWEPICTGFWQRVVAAMERAA